MDHNNSNKFWRHPFDLNAHCEEISPFVELGTSRSESVTVDSPRASDTTRDRSTPSPTSYLMLPGPLVEDSVCNVTSIGSVDMSQSSRRGKNSGNGELDSNQTSHRFPEENALPMPPPPPPTPSKQDEEMMLLNQLGHILSVLGVRKCVKYVNWWHAQQDIMESSPGCSYPFPSNGVYSPSPARSVQLADMSHHTLLPYSLPSTLPLSTPTITHTLSAVSAMPPIGHYASLASSLAAGSLVGGTGPVSDCCTSSTQPDPLSMPLIKSPRQSRWLAAGLPEPDCSDRSSNSSTDSGSRKSRGPDYICVFCRNNGESHKVYKSHRLKDVTGCIRCPVLRAYVCPTCGATGDNAHTLKYCPRAKEAARVSFPMCGPSGDVMLTSQGQRYMEYDYTCNY